MADDLARGYCSTPDPIVEEGDVGTRAASQAGKTWKPGTVLTVCFLNQVANYPDLVEQHVKEWEDCANIRFEFTNDPRATLRISFTAAPGRFYASVGKDVLIPTAANAPDGHTMSLGFVPGLNYGDAQVRGLILHEFGHALGLVHEHLRPDAPNFFRDRQAVYSYFGGPPNFWTEDMVDFNIFDRLAGQDIGNSTKYDPKSVMLYAFPPEITTIPTSSNWDLSELDRSLMRRIYPKDPGQTLGTPLTLGQATRAEHALAGTEDLYNFEVKDSGRYAMETTGDFAWAMTLFSKDAPAKAIAFDEASVRGLNARIEQQLDRGVCYLTIRSFLPDGTGTYDLSVRPATACRAGTYCPRPRRPRAGRCIRSSRGRRAGRPYSRSGWSPGGMRSSWTRPRAG